MPNHAGAWYVLPVLPKYELAAEKAIRKLGYGAMAPWALGQRWVRRKRREWRFPLYVGYVFVSLPDYADGWQRISADLNTHERRVVFRLLGDDVPATLGATDVEYIRSIADGKYTGKFQPNQLVVGDSVLVPDGYLQGKPSTIVKIKRGEHATLRVKGRKNDVELDRPLAILVRTCDIAS